MLGLSAVCPLEEYRRDSAAIVKRVGIGKGLTQLDGSLYIYIDIQFYFFFSILGNSILFY